MQADILPYTFYDSMNYETVQNTPAPQEFVRRDSPTVDQQGSRGTSKNQPASQAQRDLPPLHPPPNQGATGGGGGTAIEQLPQTDIDLNNFIDLNTGTGSARKDISNYNNTSDLWYIFIAVLAIDVLVIFMVRFFPEVFGAAVNRWYDMFGLSAVIADVGIIVIGFIIARYVYTKWVKAKFAEGKWNPLIFTATAVGVQLIHDVAFYFGVIQQVPRGQNMMMDVFKDYATSGGAKILFADALMMVGSSMLAITLKTASGFSVTSFATLIAYALPYILYTKNQFSVLR